MARTWKKPHGQLGMGYVVVKSGGTLYVGENGEWIFGRVDARDILSITGGKIDDAAYYA